MNSKEEGLLDSPVGEPPSHIGQNDEQEVDSKIPWHFWIFVSLAGIYLAFRFVQMIVAGFQAIF